MFCIVGKKTSSHGDKLVNCDVVDVYSLENMDSDEKKEVSLKRK